ncbi:ATP-dependent Zn protease [Mycena kentingensis (nom. inval.)]|nr:ATP-dependent Zn protease [Mycena kentingensis (nom. inval.)]
MDDFISVSATAGDDFHRIWSTTSASAPHANPILQAHNALKKLYPEHSLVLTPHDVIHYPDALFRALPDAPLIATTFFVPLQRAEGKVTGVLVDRPEFYAAALAWDTFDFIVYAVTYPSGFGTATVFFILHEGPEEPARKLILATGRWSGDLHNEIWVFNQGFWQKDHQLWLDVQSASWDDVVLKDEFKTALKKDIYGFFTSEPIYKKYAIPWKRGLIMYGPPGNGKTISIKVVMKTCDALGFAPLYVKSFQSWMGEEGAMREVFNKARQLSPCVVVLEDLDALINDRNRSFFLNELDGLQGNDGLLVIGTTNHFDRLDPGLSTRPSRFDRKYLFDDPDREERALYAKYWQGKLKSNSEIEFPDSLIEEVADQTKQFSFAYLKEAFVSALVSLAGFEGDSKPSFSHFLFAQIKTLRKQLDKMDVKSRLPPSPAPAPAIPKRDIRAILDQLVQHVAGRTTATLNIATPTPGTEHDLRLLFDGLKLENCESRWLGEHVPILATAQGFSRFLGLGIFQYLLIPVVFLCALLLKIPVRRNAPLLRPVKQWPLVIFSHGLCGSRNSYSQICSEIASSGRVVLAVEHRDGTAPACRARNGRTVVYCREDDVVIPENAEAISLRTEQLAFRREEVYRVYNAFRALLSGDDVGLESLDDEDADLASWKPSSDGTPLVQSEHVTLAGHSFGGCTVLSLLSSPPCDSFAPLPISNALVFDPWLEPLPSPGPAPASSFFVQLLVINSQPFTLWKDHFARLVEIVRHWGPQPARLVTLVGSEHVSFSDFPMLPLVRKTAAETLMDRVSELSVAFLEGSLEEALGKTVPTRPMETKIVGKRPDGRPKRTLVGDVGDVVISL